LDAKRWQMNYDESLLNQKIKVMKFKESAVFKELPKWFPRNEWAFKSYLSKHPELISKNAVFLGYEIYYSDLIFESGSNLIVVEAKCCRAENYLNLKIREAIDQLQTYYDTLRNITQKDISLIIAVMVNKSVSQRLTSRRLRSTIDRYRKELIDGIKSLQLKRQQMQKTIARLERRTQKLKKDIAILERKREQLRPLKNTLWEQHLEEELKIELDRLKKIGGIQRKSKLLNKILAKLLKRENITRGIIWLTKNL